MLLSMAEIVDKYTILRLKKEHGLPIAEDLSLYESAVGDLDYSELYSINRMMWILEEFVSGELDLGRVGAFYLALRFLTVKRVEAKNRIARQFNEAIEVKGYR